MNTRRGFFKCGLFFLFLMAAPGLSAKSCLWKVTSDSGTMYIQGSIHALKADNYPLAPAIEEAYAASDVLVLETDIEVMTSPATQQRIMTRAQLPVTATLEQLLDAQTYQALSDTCQRIGMPVETMAQFKPWFVGMTLTLHQLQKLGYDHSLGLDLYFHDKAKADEKSIVGLETVDFQIDLIDNLSDENPNQFIMRTLSDLSMLEEDVAALEQAWKNGDIETVGVLVTQSFEDFPSLHRTFVFDRNENWMKILTTYLDSSEIHMVVVGAGHLSGEGGLLTLLEEKGYTLEQL